MNERARAMFGLGRRPGRGQAVPRGHPQRRPARDLPRERTRRDGGPRCSASCGCATRPIARCGCSAVAARAGRRRAGRGHGAPRRDRAAPARAGAHRVRGQRVPRAAHAADRDPGLSRDAARPARSRSRSTPGASSRSCFRHTERLGRLLNDLTDLSNIELGKVTLRLAPVRLAEVVASVVAIIVPARRHRSAGSAWSPTYAPPDLPASTPTTTAWRRSSSTSSTTR